MIEFDAKSKILALQKGSLNALGELYDEYHKMVFRTALGIIGDQESASDLLQEVFLRLFRYADKVDANRPLEPWLYRVTANLSYTWIKKRRWTKPIEEISEWLSGNPNLQPTYLIEKGESQFEIYRAIQQLSISQRTAIVMYYINGCALDEISEILEIPAGTIKSRLYYGRLALRKHLDRQSEINSEVLYEFT